MGLGNLIGRYDDQKTAMVENMNEDLVTQLKRKIQYHSLEIDKAKEMLILIERNPDFEKMINLSRGLI